MHYSDSCMTSHDCQYDAGATGIDVVPFNSLSVSRHVGYGGFARVYKATHPNLGEVAVKCLLPELALSKAEVKSFICEAAMLWKCRHRFVGARCVL